MYSYIHNMDRHVYCLQAILIYVASAKRKWSDHDTWLQRESKTHKNWAGILMLRTNYIYRPGACQLVRLEWPWAVGTSLRIPDI